MSGFIAPAPYSLRIIMVSLTTASRKRAGQLAALLVADLLFFGATNARQATSYLMIIGFVLLVLTAYVVVYGLLGLARMYGVPVKRRRQLTIWLTAGCGAILALQSIGELGAHDIFVLLPLAALGYMYSNYVRAARRNLDG
jgi:hypothetical protein